MVVVEEAMNDVVKQLYIYIYTNIKMIVFDEDDGLVGAILVKGGKEQQEN